MFMLSIICTTTYAWFDFTEKQYDEVLHRSLEREEIPQFKKLFGICEEKQQEVDVFTRVLLEKKEELENYDTILSTQYGVSSSRSYTYNPTNLTIYVVIPEKGETKTLPHRIFVTKEEGDSFLKIIIGKKIVVEQLDLLDELCKEKQQELTSVQGILNSAFLVKPDKKYKFDESSRKIYELRKRKTQEEIKAEKEALRKKQEEVELKIKAAEEKKRKEEAKAKAEAKAKKEAAEKVKREKKERYKKLSEQVELSEEHLSDIKKKYLRAEKELKDSKEKLDELKKEYSALQIKKKPIERLQRQQKKLDECHRLVALNEKNLIHIKGKLNEAEKKFNQALKELNEFKN